MTDRILNTREAISALADGQLRGQEFVRAVEAVHTNGDARAAWHAYHLVGDVLRTGDLPDRGNDLDFVVRLQARLQEERIVTVAPDAPKEIADTAISTGAKSHVDTKKDSSNASWFNWRVGVGLATVSAVAVLSWSLAGGGVGGGRSDLLAAVPMPAAVQATSLASGQAAGGQEPVMIRDPRLDELMAAHRQFGGASALQMPTGFLQNATFESSGR